jgi:hypothetical protein
MCCRQAAATISEARPKTQGAGLERIAGVSTTEPLRQVLPVETGMTEEMPLVRESS